MMRPWSSWVRAAVLGPAILLSSVALGGTQAEDPLEVEPAVIRAVRYHVEPARTRVWFETSGTLFYTHYGPDPLTLVIDLPGVDITAISDRIVVGSQEVESIVATRLDGGGDKSLSRIEIKLSSLVPYQILATEHALTVLFEGAGSPAEAPPIAVVPSAVPTDTTTTSASTDDIVDTDDAVATETVESEPTTEPAEQRPVSAPSVPVRSATSVDSVSHTVAEGLLTVTVGADGRLNYTCASSKLLRPRNQGLTLRLNSGPKTAKLRRYAQRCCLPSSHLGSVPFGRCVGAAPIWCWRTSLCGSK